MTSHWPLDEGIPVWVVSPEDLILLKLVVCRNRDRADIDDVLLVKGVSHVSYTRFWTDRLNVRAELEQELRARQM